MKKSLKLEAKLTTKSYKRFVALVDQFAIDLVA